MVESIEEASLRMMGDPLTWPNMVLPVKKAPENGKGSPDTGVIVGVEEDGSITMMHGNIWMPHDWKDPVVFEDVTEMFEAGWRVD